MTKNEVAIVDHVPQGKMMLLDYMADKYSLNPDEFSRTVRAVCGMPTATPEQFAAFLLVAKTYDLNPLIKEIYAFPAKGGGIVPIVSIDGWVNLVNSHPMCNGYQFEPEHTADGKLVSFTCTMHRKDREYPVNVTEYLSECKRATDPWKMEHRMLRHKSMIQAARYAFGFAGIYDPDEGEKIAAGGVIHDAGPPRQVNVPPDQPKQIEATANKPEPEPEEARDGTPPPRQPKEAKSDPISSGPPRTTAPKAATPKDDGPSDLGPQPHKIPGTGETFETWTEKFITMINTSPDKATLLKWSDLNADPLARLAKGKPSCNAKVNSALKRAAEQFAYEQGKADAKAAKKAAPPADMDAPGDMDGDATDAPTDPEAILKAIDGELDAVDDPDMLQSVWDEVCEPLVAKLDFPPDQDAAQGLYRKHEQRLS